MPVSQFRNYSGTLSSKADTRSSATVADKASCSFPLWLFPFKWRKSFLYWQIKYQQVFELLVLCGRLQVMHQRSTPTFIGDGRFLSNHAVGIYCKESLPVKPVMLQEKKKSNLRVLLSCLALWATYGNPSEDLNTQWASIWKHRPEEL